MPYILAYAAKYALKAILFTCRVDVKGLAAFIELAKREKCILMLWHNRLALIPEIMRQNASQFNYKAFISKCQDADPLVILTNSYAIGGVIRVSHDTRHLALNQVITHLKEQDDIIIMTPDGPRGPRYRIKPGVVVAAKHSGANIIPIMWKASRYWQTSTWDKLIIPKPFSKIQFTFGEPVVISAEDNITDKVVFLENEMTRLLKKN